MQRASSLPLRATLNPEPTIHDEIEAAFNEIDPNWVLELLGQYRNGRGRKGYSLEAFWRATLAGYILNVGSTAELRRRLRDDDKLRALCGFSRVPHHTAFYRFNGRLAENFMAVGAAFKDITLKIGQLLPDFGADVALDSTVVRSHSNPRKPIISDPDASWTAKSSKKNKKGEIKKEWHWGYKLHLVADAKYGLPLNAHLTSARESDSTEMLRLIFNTNYMYPGWIPDSVSADKGYDSTVNYVYLEAMESAPIIPIRKLPPASTTQLYEGIYTKDALTCVGGEPMKYVRSDPKDPLRHLFRCASEGCRLKNRKGVLYCKDETWAKADNPRYLGSVLRSDPKWKRLYRMRQSVERVFKSLKESRRLERHYIRGLRKTWLHAWFSMLAFQATALFCIRRGERDKMRWQVRPAA